MAELFNGMRTPGMPLKAAGGLPRPVGPVDAATGKKLTTISSTTSPSQLRQPNELEDMLKVKAISPSLASMLRPQAAYRWILPYLAAITPQYVESVLRGALAGNHVQAWELFDLMCDTDPEIISCVQEYCEGVLSHKVMFEPWHEEDEEPSDMALEKTKVVSSALRSMRPDPTCDENALHGTMRDLLFARFHGQSVLEIDWADAYGSDKWNIKKVAGLNGQILAPRSTYWVHPVCYAWSMEGRLGLRASIGNLRDTTNTAKQNKLGMVEPPAWNWISSQARPSDLQEFPRNKFLISVFKSKTGTALGGSVLRPLAWWWVASNFCGDWLLNYAQLFGIPFRKASYAPGTPVETQAEIRQMLQSCGSSGYILLPDTADLEFMEGGSNGGNSPQAFLFHFADSQKRKVILHQTMTGGQHDSMGKGGGKAFGEVEADTKGGCIEAGARFVEDQVNQQLVPMILELNYGADGGDLEAPECKLVHTEVGDLTDAQRDVALSGIINIPAGYLRRKFGIPKAGPEDEIAGQDQGTAAAQAKQAQENLEADRQQADKHAKLNAEVAKHTATQNAKAKAAQPAAPPAGSAGQGQQGEQESANDNQEMSARNALKASDSTTGKGCLMAMVPKDQADKIVQWSKNNITDLVADGIETEPHVTVLYGFNVGFDTSKLSNLLSYLKPLVLTVGKISRFESAEYDVIKCDVDSIGAENMHKRIAGALSDDITPSEHAYHPHLTLAYVAKGSNKDLDGQDPFSGMEFTGELLYSEPNKTNRKTINLKARRLPVSFDKSDAKEVAVALHGTVEPLLARMEAINKVDDEELRAKLITKLLKDIPQLKAAMIHDDSLAKAVAPVALAHFIESLKKGQK